MSIDGHVYVQGGTEGLASYHFTPLLMPYISYASAPVHWNLDGKKFVTFPIYILFLLYIKSIGVKICIYLYIF